MTQNLKPFQVGDTVRVLPTESDPDHGLHANALLTVEHADETHVRVSGSPYEWFARRFELVEPADAATTQLDPSKVKAGDTVTLTLGKAILTDEVRVLRPSHDSRQWRAFELSQDQKGESPRAVKLDPTADIDAWTLTGHQPAPEPEPELPTRGTFGWADTVDGRRHGFVVGGTNGSDYRAFRYYLPEGDYSRATESFSNFVPDVVIDPASDYVQGLIRLAHDKAASPEGERDRALVRDLLKGLGIEAS